MGGRNCFGAHAAKKKAVIRIIIVFFKLIFKEGSGFRVQGSGFKGYSLLISLTL